MALSEEQVETLEFIFDKMEKGDAGVLSDWERSFMTDQKTRYDQYAAETRFSDRQWAVIDKIEAALIENRPSKRG